MKAANVVLLEWWYYHLCHLKKSCRFGCPWVGYRADCWGEKWSCKRGTRTLVLTLCMHAFRSLDCFFPSPSSSPDFLLGERKLLCLGLESGYCSMAICLCFIESHGPGTAGRD